MPKKKNNCHNFGKCFVRDWCFKTKRYSDLSSLVALSRIRSCLHKNETLRWVHSNRKFRQPKIVNKRRKKTWWQEFCFEYRCSQMEVSKHEPQPTHCDEAPQRQWNKCSYKFKKLLKTRSPRKMQYMKLNSPKHRLNTRNNRCETHHSSISKTTNVGTLLHFSQFCDLEKIEEMEKGTDSLYLVVAEVELRDCVWHEMTNRLEAIAIAGF